MKLARRSLPVVLTAVLLALSSTSPASAVVTPPAGTPNLALMVIQPADLVPGAVIGDQAYVTPPAGFTADYGSVFSSASTPDGVKYALLEDYVALAPSATLAGDFFADQQSLFDTTKGRKDLTKEIIKDAGKHAHLKPRDVKYTDAGTAGVASSSFIETITIRARHAKLQEVVVLFADADVEASLVIAGTTDETIPQSDGVGLSTTIDSHIHAVLAGTGATGAT
jgi:hypothetical protein